MRFQTMRRAFCFSLVVCVAAIHWGAESEASDSSADAKGEAKTKAATDDRLTGAWGMVAMEIDGKTHNLAKGAGLQFEKSGVASESRDDLKELPEETYPRVTRYLAKQNQKPKQLSVFCRRVGSVAEEEREYANNYIYEVIDDVLLSAMIANSEKSFPERFEAPDRDSDGMHFVYVYFRSLDAKSLRDRSSAEKPVETKDRKVSDSKTLKLDTAPWEKHKDEELLGRWKLIASREKGEFAKKKRVEDLDLSAGGSLKVIERDAGTGLSDQVFGPETTADAHFQLGPTGDSRVIEMSSHNPSIYRIVDDVLVMCESGNADKAPTSFTSTKDNGQTLRVYIRPYVKKDQDAEG